MLVASSGSAHARDDDQDRYDADDDDDKQMDDADDDVADDGDDDPVDLELDTFDKGSSVFWAKSTRRYVAKFGKQRCYFPVYKNLSPDSRMLKKKMQRKRALLFAETGEVVASHDDDL